MCDALRSFMPALPALKRGECFRLVSRQGILLRSQYLKNRPQRVYWDIGLAGCSSVDRPYLKN